MADQLELFEADAPRRCVCSAPAVRTDLNGTPWCAECWPWEGTLTLFSAPAVEALKDRNRERRKDNR